jgi:hypothetical protein
MTYMIFKLENQCLKNIKKNNIIMESTILKIVENLKFRLKISFLNHIRYFR